MTERNHYKTKKIQKLHKNNKKINSGSQSSDNIQTKTPKMKEVKKQCQFKKFIESVPPAIQSLKELVNRPSEAQKQQQSESQVEMSFIQSQIQCEVTQKIEALRRKFNRTKPYICQTCHIWILNWFTNLYRKIIYHNCGIQTKPNAQQMSFGEIRKLYFGRIINVMQVDFGSISQGFESLDKHDTSLEVQRVKSPRLLLFPSDKDICDVYSKSDNEEQADDYLYCQFPEQLDKYEQELRKKHGEQ